MELIAPFLLWLVGKIVKPFAERAGERITEKVHEIIVNKMAKPMASPSVGGDASAEPAHKVGFKGLRAFARKDAGFFLELLPGSRGPDGLPECVRFWKHQIEETDPDKTFRVGLLYGPSGCGKSSLMEAGIIPSLADSIVPVYVEATAHETESRLLNALRRYCPYLPPKSSLLSTVQKKERIPEGKKVVLVLDQFEQWLHAKSETENSELLQVLRECDGEQIQCVLMIRDDFWTPVSRFLKQLDVQQQERKNMQMVDLFDPPHAKKVLSAFGQAFGALGSELSKVQNAFLDQAVAGLAQDGKVISVRLTLFAEMVKGKPWTPATLKEVGGTDGVGVTFLEETFTASTAPPQHRLHQKAAQAVLKALLPESGADIKGHMRSHAALLEASGYANHPKDFDDLIQILDNEIRLITPTDPAGKEAADEATPSAQGEQKYYQLTHDYLVPSLRDWLTRKQKETRRGRAELLLADRAAVWNARPENRQLPSLWQWLQIHWLTQKKTWTPPQRNMIVKAGRYHGVRGAILTVLLTAGILVGLGIRSQVIEQNKATRADGLVQAVLNAETGQVKAIIGEMTDYRSWADPLLRQETEKATANSRQKLHASLAFLPGDATQVDYLFDRLLDAEPHEVPVIRDALAPHKDQLLAKLWSVVEQPAKGKESQRLRAASALAIYEPSSQRWTTVSGPVVDDLVAVNPVFLGLWSDQLRPVKAKLLERLSAIFRDHQPERATERTLATNLLADYAREEPQVLADLLMDADEKQFAVLYPEFKDHGERGLVFLHAEVSKKSASEGLEIFRKLGSIAQADAKVKVSDGKSLPAKVFEVRLQAGKTYFISMNSKELDSFLVLQDKTGKELAFDDEWDPLESTCRHASLSIL